MVNYFLYAVLITLCGVCEANSEKRAVPVVDFLESILHVSQQSSETEKKVVVASQVKGWEVFKPLFDACIVDNPEYAPQVRIPKIIHHIWLGSPLPKKYAQLIETWRKHHPEWQLILWDDAKIAELNLFNMRPYCAATNYGEKSDIARYEILYRFGGLYVDTDFECLQSFDVFHHCCDFYVGTAPTPGGGDLYTINALIGSAPGHLILKRCIEGIKRLPNARNDAHSIMERTGPAYLGRCLVTAIKSGDALGRCVVFPPTYFYPWPGILRARRNRSEIMEWIRPESFALHHWAASWTNDFGHSPL